ncbi:MAG: hypothetical protein QXT19_02930 [Candidatus Woesearchaeota archaeon]
MSGDVYNRNRELITRVYELGLRVADKNRYVAARLMNSIIPLLTYNGRLLSKLKPRELAAMGCIRKENVVYVYRVLQGESIDSIAEDIPALNETPVEQVAPKTSRRKKLEDSGEFHIATRTLEDRCV